MEGCNENEKRPRVSLGSEHVLWVARVRKIP